MRRVPRLCGAGALSVMALAPALGASVPAREFMYEVRPGDTLSAIAGAYLGNATQWPRLMRHNRIEDPRRLVPGSMLRISERDLAWTRGTARLIQLQGQASAVRAGETSNVPLSLGQWLGEGDVLRVDAGAQVSLRLSDGTVLQLQPASVVRLERLRSIAATGAPRTVLGIDRGRVDLDVHDLHEQRGRLDVRTPLAVASVRGTRFGVDVREHGEAAIDVLGGAVELWIGSRSGGGAQSRPGARPATPPLVLPSGSGAIVAGSSSPPIVRALLAPPDLSGLSPLYETPVPSVEVPHVPGAVSVRVQVARDKALREIVLSRVEPQRSSGSQVQLGGLPDGQYFVAARAIDADGLVGQEALRPMELRARPEPPIQLTPPNSGVILRSSVELRCAEVAGAVAYEFQLKSGVGPAAERAGVTQRTPDCNWALPAPLPAGEYAWRVAAAVQGPAPEAAREPVRGPYGSWAEFLASEVPAVPQPSLEFAGATVTLRWSVVAGIEFELQVARDRDFTHGLRAWRVQEGQAQLDLLACQEQYVQVRAIDGHGFKSAYSGTQRIAPLEAVCTVQGEPVLTSDGTALLRRP